MIYWRVALVNENRLRHKVNEKGRKGMFLNFTG